MAQEQQKAWNTTKVTGMILTCTRLMVKRRIWRSKRRAHVTKDTKSTKATQGKKIECSLRTMSDT